MRIVSLVAQSVLINVYLAMWEEINIIFCLF